MPVPDPRSLINCSPNHFVNLWTKPPDSGIIIAARGPHPLWVVVVYDFDILRIQT